MDIISLRRRIDRLIHSHSSSLTPAIADSGFSCTRCGWCCCRNFDIRITEHVSRPSNAISIFPSDIRRIVKSAGRTWDEVAEPDIYSCFGDCRVIGWILRRDPEGNCIFYRQGECTIYSCRPMICRCYPFFISDGNVEIMHCRGLGQKITLENAYEISLMLKRYEIAKLQSYIKIIQQLRNKLGKSNMRSLPEEYTGEIIVFDGEAISRCTL